MAWSEVQEKIAQACQQAARKVSEVQVLAISKGHDAGAIRQALAQPAFPPLLGESYLEELKEKRGALKALELQWHFVGRLQSRKIAEIVAQASVLHAVGRAKELEEIAKAQTSTAHKVKLFLQVNVSSEDSKNGVLPVDLPALIEKVSQLGLDSSLAGLMTMAAPIDEVGEAEVRRQYAELRNLRDKFCAGGALSMGVSADYEMAVLEGASILRLGSVLFGPRVQ